MSNCRAITWFAQHTVNQFNNEKPYPRRWPLSQSSKQLLIVAPIKLILFIEKNKRWEVYRIVVMEIAWWMKSFQRKKNELSCYA